MKKSYYRRFGPYPPKVRRLDVPKLKVWGRILVRSGRTSPTHFWKPIVRVSDRKRRPGNDCS